MRRAGLARKTAAGGCAANERANRKRAKSAYRGSADATPRMSALVEKPGNECVRLIIRRSWVRSLPAPLAPALAAVPLTCAKYG
jgi:hypothetical protein